MINRGTFIYFFVQVEGMQVHANEGGATQTRGGIYWLILPAGCNALFSQNFICLMLYPLFCAILHDLKALMLNIMMPYSKVWGKIL